MEPGCRRHGRREPGLCADRHHARRDCVGPGPRSLPRRRPRGRLSFPVGADPLPGGCHDRADQHPRGPSPSVDSARLIPSVGSRSMASVTRPRQSAMSAYCIGAHGRDGELAVADRRRGDRLAATALAGHGTLLPWTLSLASGRSNVGSASSRRKASCPPRSVVGSIAVRTMSSGCSSSRVCPVVALHEHKEDSGRSSVGCCAGASRACPRQSSPIVFVAVPATSNASSRSPTTSNVPERRVVPGDGSRPGLEEPPPLLAPFPPFPPVPSVPSVPSVPVTVRVRHQGHLPSCLTEHQGA